jgi:hypothetical protein
MFHKQVSLRAVIFKSGEHWVGQCLEHDIAAQATEPREVPDQLERAIAAHIVIACENNVEPFEILPKAPSRYWKMFDRGLQLAAPVQRTVVVDGRSVKTPEVEARVSDRQLVPA